MLRQITDSAAVGRELTPKVKASLCEVGRLLTGPARRAFLAQVTDSFFGGSARQPSHTTGHVGSAASGG